MRARDVGSGPVLSRPTKENRNKFSGNSANWGQANLLDRPFLKNARTRRFAVTVGFKASSSGVLKKGSSN